MTIVLERWYRKIWITKACRFNAHARYEQHASLSSLTLILLNVYVIAINLFPLIPSLKGAFPTEDTTIYTIILSILMLTVGQFVSSKEYRIKALRFHDCGKELSIIYDEVDLLKRSTTPVDEKRIEDIINKYNTIIQKHESNHKSIDLMVFIADNYKEFHNNTKKPFLLSTRVMICKFFQVSLIYWVCIIIPPILFSIYLIK